MLDVGVLGFLHEVRKETAKLRPRTRTSFVIDFIVYKFFFDCSLPSPAGLRRTAGDVCYSLGLFSRNVKHNKCTFFA